MKDGEPGGMLEAGQGTSVAQIREAEVSAPGQAGITGESIYRACVLIS